MTGTPSPHRKHVEWLLLAFSAGLVVVLVLRWLTGDQYVVVRLFNYFTFWLLLGILPALTVALCIRNYLAAGLLVIPLFYALTVYAPLFSLRDEAPRKHGTPFSVMSFNILFRNADLAASADIVLEERPDILLLQELTPPAYLDLQTMLADLYPDGEGYRIYDPVLQQAIFSRHPILAHRAFPSMGKILKAVISFSGREISLYNIHALHSWNLEERRRMFAALLNGPIARERGGVILAGDFNTTARTEMYGLITRRLRDAHREVGQGLGFTWPAFGMVGLMGINLPPLMRIDYIFYNDGLAALSAETLKESGGADHLPVTARFVLSTARPRTSPSSTSPEPSR